MHSNGTCINTTSGHVYENCYEHCFVLTERKVIILKVRVL